MAPLSPTTRLSYATVRNALTPHPRARVFGERQVIHKACAADYLYYGTPSPWLHVKLLKFLQMFPPPTDRSQREKLDEALERIITKTEVK